MYSIIGLVQSLIGSKRMGQKRIIPNFREIDSAGNHGLYEIEFVYMTQGIFGFVLYKRLIEIE